MKKRRILFLLGFCLIIFGSCELSEDGSYVVPITNYEKIAGTWSLTGITQTDEIAKAGSFEPSEVGLITQFGFSDFQITFNVDESFQPTSFEVSGNAPELFLTGGYWKLDEPFVHADGSISNILLYSDEAKTQLVDQLGITTVPGAVSKLAFKLTRSTGQTPYVSYSYELTPLQP